MAPIKLIALDLDGTLLGTDSKVHEPERETIQKARQAGVQTVVCTGRSTLDASPHAEAAGGIDWLITENGARIVSASGETIYYHAMTSEHIDRLLTLCEKHGVEPSFYGQNTIWYGAKCLAFLTEMSRIIGKMPVDMSDFTYISTPEEWRALSNEIIFKAIVYGDKRDLDAWLTDMQQSGMFEAEPSVFCNLKNVEINAKGTDKGTALMYLAKHLGLTAEQVMACGDSDNDRTMLQKAGLGVAMGNAPEHIQAISDVTTETNANHGVSVAIEKYVLNA